MNTYISTHEYMLRASLDYNKKLSECTDQELEQIRKKVITARADKAWSGNGYDASEVRTRLELLTKQNKTKRMETKTITEQKRAHLKWQCAWSRKDLTEVTSQALWP